MPLQKTYVCFIRAGNYIIITVNYYINVVLNYLDVQSCITVHINYIVIGKNTNNFRLLSYKHRIGLLTRSIESKIINNLKWIKIFCNILLICATFIFYVTYVCMKIKENSKYFYDINPLYHM